MPFTVSHVGLNVTDMERAKRFYTAVFELNVIHETHTDAANYAFLGNDSGLLITLWRQSEGQFSPGYPGLHHLALQLEDVTAVQAFESRLRALGVTPLHDGIVAHARGRTSSALYFLDPDGIRLEVCAPNGGEDHEAPSGELANCGFF